MFLILKADIVDDENPEKGISIKSNKTYFYFRFTDFIILIRRFFIRYHVDLFIV